MSGKKEKKHLIVGIIMVAIIVAATATMIYCYINRFDPREYVQAFLDVSYKQKTESYIKQTGISEKEAKQIILETDKRYHKRHMALTGSNRGDRHNRDILIDSSLLGVDGTARLIETLAKQVEKQ